ncbi:Tetratricopeptide repeat-containing protein [Ectothiorhodospira magna]|uniref:Tetratricopeptide repeat-containing protein n=1 Tax=Ectothiorhodospira magna TaxID=867345 RepID=A0A1H9CMC3_9GAMM|nr:tetratricopeptide repeat protein [Ectothiorhodospira magna]SEQ02362.1 Tetratricopeptide repeat-containing protein [Ectothiorhodospira magna]
MARKRNKKPSSPNKVASSLSADAIQSLGYEALAEGKYRDAINHFKTLAKIEPEACWQQGLLEAYEGRAQVLEAKGMLKEALAIRENRRRFESSPDPRYIALLLRLGRIPDALTAYTALSQTGDTRSLAQVRSLIAAIDLSRDTPIEGLPADDPVYVDGVHARHALAAWCRGDDEQVAQHLKAIPFRSPYRDLTLILKAMLCLPQDCGKTSALLDKIAADSAFAPLADAARLVLLPEADFIAALPNAGEQSARFAMNLRGWSPERQSLWRELIRRGPEPGPAHLMDVIEKHRQMLGDTWANQKLIRLIHAQWPAKVTPAILKALPSYESFILKAWTTPRFDFHDQEDALCAWENLINVITSGKKPKPGTPDALRVALIHRHLFETLDLSDSDFRKAIEVLLQKNLELVPDEIEEHSFLIQYYQEKKDIKVARRIVEQGLARWPENVTMLNAALDIAIATKAYKKAATLARRILERDPINRHAAQSLFDAHLAHATKQVKKNRPDLAFKEMETAIEWARTSQDKDRAMLMRALLQVLNETPGAIEEVRVRAHRLGQTPLASALAVVLQGSRLGLKTQHTLSLVGMDIERVPDPDDLMRCRDLLQDNMQRISAQSLQMTDILQPFHKPLIKAIQGPLPYQDYECWCELLSRTKDAVLYLMVARIAVDHYPDKPLFVFHEYRARQIQTEIHRAHFWLDDDDVERLETAHSLARSQGDIRTAQRLSDILDALYGFDSSASLLPDDIEDTVDLMIQVFYDHAPLNILRQMQDVEKRHGYPGLVNWVINYMAHNPPPSWIPPLDQLDS